MATTQQDNKALVKRFIREVVNNQKYGLVDDLFTADYTRHDPNTPGTEHGPEPWVENLKPLHTAFPDGRVHIGELIAEDDIVAFEGTMSATHDGPFRGIEPTGTAFEITGNAMHRIEDGRIAETWATWDFLSILEKIGAIDVPER